MKTSHTPGPWAVAETTGSEVLIKANGVVGPDSFTIATVSDPRFDAGKPFPVDIANARLIAAAPELLAALIELDKRGVELAERCEALDARLLKMGAYEGTAELGEITRLKPAVNAARAAIAKATA